MKSLVARGSLVLFPAIGAASIALSTMAAAGPTVHAPLRPVAHPGALRHTAATTTFYAGGATLPAIAYLGPPATTMNPVTAPAAGSVFGYFLQLNSAFGISYCQTGSGFGKGAIEQNPSDPANGACAPLGASATGFGAPTVHADFAGADSPYSSTDYTTFGMDAGAAGYGEPVQIPYIAGAVAILYSNKDVTSQLRITEPTLCKIADGEITNWNQIPVDPTNPKGAKYPSKTLYFVYREDGSGTTFSFSNHLSAVTSGNARKVCTAKGETYALNQYYDAFNNNKAQTLGALPNPLPGSNAGFRSGSGNVGVTGCITNAAGASCFEPAATAGGAPVPTSAPTDGAIGYVEAANAASAVTGASQNFALIHKGTKDYSPTADLPAAAKTIVATDLVTGDVVGSAVANGRPVPELVAVSPADACLGLVDPQKYDDPAKGYPILAVTNLELASAKNNSPATLQTLAKFTSVSTNYGAGKITSVDPKSATTGQTGYSQLGLSTTSINKLAACIGS